VQTILNDAESLVVYLFDGYFGRNLRQSLYLDLSDVLKVLESELLILDNEFQVFLAKKHQKEEEGHVGQFFLGVLQEAAEDEERDVVEEEGLEFVVGVFGVGVADQRSWVSMKYTGLGSSRIPCSSTLRAMTEGAFRSPR
jgi:hypothetical protein